VTRGAQIQTNSNKNRKLIQKNRKPQKTEYFWMCLDFLFVKTAGTPKCDASFHLGFISLIFRGNESE
jgi:hypothetical protein